MLTLQLYQPKGIEPFAFHGSTCNIGRSEEREAAVLKYYKERWWDPTISMSSARRSLYRDRYQIEHAILRHLGQHPRIVKFLGSTTDLPGLWLREARNGDLQLYLEKHNDSIDANLRKRWCLQATEGVNYIHEKEVLHCDLRPANCLLDDELNLALCDFGGSRFRGMSGMGLPDSGFYDPNDKKQPSKAMDIFGLGSLLYMIMTGHLPHAETIERGPDYDNVVNQRFEAGQFPCVDHITNGSSIQACWDGTFNSAMDVFQSLEQY